MHTDRIGSIEEFSVKPWVDAANYLVAYDDPLRALELLDLLPGYYRDHYPIELQNLKSKIYEKLATPAFYARAVENQIVSLAEAKSGAQSIPRFAILKQHLESIQKPVHITELAPGPYVVPQMMINSGVDFTYNAVSLNPSLEREAKDKLEGHWRSTIDPDRFKVLVAFEFIEHLHHEQDIWTDSLRAGMDDPDAIHISTPKYTFDGRKEALNWEDKDLGHLRTYTPNEFVKVISQMFLGYKWELYDGAVMHLKGVR